MNRPKISIIVPVYNVEKYLDECLKSILNQLYENKEVILVDDGSTDSSGAICDRYAEKYNCIRVVHKKNGGVSDSRNKGMENATGDYVLFVDADDFIEEGSLDLILEEIANKKEQPDVVFLEAFKVYENQTKETLGDGYNADFISERPKATVMSHLSKLPKFPGSACTKMTKKSLVDENNLFFETGRISAEDIDWTIRLLKVAQSFEYSSVPYYCYRQGRKGSATNNIGLKNVQDILHVVERHADKDIEKREFQKELNAFLAYEYMIALFNFARLSRTDKEAVYKRFRNSAWVMKYASNKKTRIVAIALRIAGIRLTSWLLNVVYKA